MSQLWCYFLWLQLYFTMWLYISQLQLYNNCKIVTISADYGCIFKNMIFFLLYLTITFISSSACIILIILHIVAIYCNIKTFQCLILRTYVYSHHLMSNEKPVETNSSAFIAACSSACTVSCKLEISWGAYTNKYAQTHHQELQIADMTERRTQTHVSYLSKTSGFHGFLSLPLREWIQSS